MNKESMNIYCEEVQGATLKKIPESHETIEDYCHTDRIIRMFDKIHVWFRDKDSCPFNKGNWIMDFHSKDYFIPRWCIKLPAEMTEEQIKKFIKPLIDKIKEKMN